MSRHPRSVKRLGLLAAAIGTVTAVVALAASSLAPAAPLNTALRLAAAHKCLVMSGSGDPVFTRNFNPFTSTGIPSGQFTKGAFYEGLIISPEGGKPAVPWLAQSWKWSNANKTLTLNLAHARPHFDTSTEFHTESGPFTLVPLPGRRSSLVCVLDPAHAAELAAMNDAELSLEIERRAHSLFGAMTVEPGRGIFPLAIETADASARDRIALVGEAAHVVPPIGAQGLNLGLRDGATIAELVAEALRQNVDIGAPEVLARYDTQRRADVTSRSIAVDLLNRSLLTDFLPAQGARGLSLYLVDRIGPLRRALMREGVAPAASQPRLMRGEMV